MPTLLTRLALLALFFAASPALAQNPGAAVREAFAQYDRADGPGAIVAVMQGGELVYAEAFGMANLTHGVPLSTATRSNIGSTSKQLTAYALLTLESEGRLSLDDDVRDYLPALPDFGQTVTLRNLLTHTSGYREFLNVLLLEGRQVLGGDVVERREVVGVVQRQPELQNAPGSEWNYNNTGYALAAQVVEKVTGNAFAEWMRARVFEPNGMDSTLVRAKPGQVVPGSAQGYVPSAVGRYSEVSDLGGAMGAGGIYTTAQDLAAWMRIYAEGGPLVTAMTTEAVTTAGDSTGYGLGLFLDTERGQRRWHHGGADAAHRASFAYYPDLHGGYLILSNDAAFDPSLAATVADAFFGAQMEPRREDAAPPDATDFDASAYDPADFDDFAGRYALDVAPTFILSFFREGDALYTQATGQQRNPIVPTSDSTFALTQVEASVAFHRDDTGAVTGATLFQNGQHHATRLPDEDATVAPAADFSAYAGRYFSDELETTYRIAPNEAGDGLTLRQRRFGKISLTHTEGDAFVGELPVATAEFERDAEGVVEALVVGNGRARGVRFVRVE